MTQHFPLTPGRRESGERPAGLPITTSAREHSRGTAGWMSAPEAAHPWGQVLGSIVSQDNNLVN